MTEYLRAALQELVTLLDIKERYAAARPDSPRHPQWQQYLDDTQGFPDRWIHALANARSALASQDMEQRAGWISVEDRLPKPGVNVLAFFRYQSTGKGRVIRAMHAPQFGLSEEDFGEFQNGGDYNEADDTTYWPEGWYESNEFDETSWCVHEEVTRWMPLPAHPIEALEGGKTDLGASGPVHQDTSSTPAPDSDRRTELLAWCYSKLHYRSFDNMEDALVLDEIKLLLEHGV